MYLCYPLGHTLTTTCMCAHVFRCICVHGCVILSRSKLRFFFTGYALVHMYAACLWWYSSRSVNTFHDYMVLFQNQLSATVHSILLLLSNA